MASYGELKSDLAALLTRSDLGGAIPGFISLAHAEFNRRFRLRQMEATESIAPVDGLYALPDDYLTYRSVVLESNPRRTLEAVSTDYLDSRYGNREVGCTSVFAVEGSSIRVAPASASNLELRYYQKIPALVDDSDTNWLLDKEPGLYLYGSAIHSAPFLRHDARLAMWVELATAIGKSLESENNLATRSNGGARLKGPTP